MAEIVVYHYDAFSTIPNKGNPAGVVVCGDHLSEADMQEIAYKIGFNETAFVVNSDRADLRIRYFTPGHEMNLCGHGTIATLFCLRSMGMLSLAELTIETKAGILPIRVESEQNEVNFVMQQASPQFIPFEGDIEELASSMNLTSADIDPSMPIVYGSTGIWTVLIPIRTLEAFNRMKPINDRFPSILTQNPRASLHPFCLETVDPDTDMHARHFSSPFSGTIEDPVTGTASGVMGACYMTYLDTESQERELLIEQGLEMNRDGRVQVRIARLDKELQVEIKGTAVYVSQLNVMYG